MTIVLFFHTMFFSYPQLGSRQCGFFRFSSHHRQRPSQGNFCIMFSSNRARGRTGHVTKSMNQLLTNISINQLSINLYFFSHFTNYINKLLLTLIIHGVLYMILFHYNLLLLSWLKSSSSSLSWSFTRSAFMSRRNLTYIPNRNLNPSTRLTRITDLPYFLW